MPSRPQGCTPSWPNRVVPPALLRTVRCVDHHLDIREKTNAAAADAALSVYLQVLDILSKNASNPVVLSGDVHNAYVWSLFGDDASTPVSPKEQYVPLCQSMAPLSGLTGSTLHAPRYMELVKPC